MKLKVFSNYINNCKRVGIAPRLEDIEALKVMSKKWKQFN